MEYNETGYQTPVGATKPCANGCGFYVTAATRKLCSKCHRDFKLKQEQTEQASLSPGCMVDGSSSSSIDICSTLESSTSALKTEVQMRPKEGPKRCSTCQKRVGLTGFNCRCGSIFCAVHRYSDKHGCSYDYRTAARTAIAKANPVVKAQKLNKI